MKTYKCDICGKEHAELNAYLSCVFKCGSELQTKMKKEEERLKKMNEALSKVKEAKEIFEKKLNEFKNEYPEAYKLNFESNGCCDHDSCDDCCDGCGECKDECDCNKDHCDTESFEFEYFDNGKDKPKMSAKVNGKDASNDILKMMEENPDTKYIAKLLGIL